MIETRFQPEDRKGQGGYEFTVQYETEGVRNRAVHRFFELEAGRTRWVTENEFKFSGWMRLLALFLGAAFRKQTLDEMQRFKAFAEPPDPSISILKGAP